MVVKVLQGIAIAALAIGALYPGAPSAVREFSCMVLAFGALYVLGRDLVRQYRQGK